MKEETNRLLKAIEESNKKMQITETSIKEKDQRIGELDRLIERMEEVWELVIFKDNAEVPEGNFIYFLVACCSVPYSLIYHFCYCIHINKYTWIIKETLWLSDSTFLMITVRTALCSKPSF